MKTHVSKDNEVIIDTNVSGFLSPGKRLKSNNNPVRTTSAVSRPTVEDQIQRRASSMEKRGPLSAFFYPWTGSPNFRGSNSRIQPLNAVRRRRFGGHQEGHCIRQVVGLEALFKVNGKEWTKKSRRRLIVGWISLLSRRTRGFANS
jgi:hypothetical protein